MEAPKVTPQQIDALMEQVVYHTYAIPETTSTVAVAFLNGFSLGIGHSACVSPENFDAELGKQYACEDAEKATRKKLWELEGYYLHRKLAEAAHGDLSA